MNSTEFDARELSSRKLWQLVNTQQEEDVSEKELRAAIEELATRRHYLAKLQKIGIIKGQNAGV